MGLFLCSVCNKDLLGDMLHVCKREDIEERIEKLEIARGIAENRLQSIQDAVYRLLEALPSLSEPTSTVDSDWLRKLWNATQCAWYEAKTADSFLIRWMAMHDILRCAFDLFRKPDKDSALTKLIRLYEACNRAKEVLGYQSSKFTVSPEQFLR